MSLQPFVQRTRKSQRSFQGRWLFMYWIRREMIWSGQEAVFGLTCAVCCPRLRISDPVQGVPSTGKR